jgi:hypothetical protein
VPGVAQGDGGEGEPGGGIVYRAIMAVRGVLGELRGVSLTLGGEQGEGDHGEGEGSASGRPIPSPAVSTAEISRRTRPSAFDLEGVDGQPLEAAEE